MAQKVTISITSDLSDAEDASTVAFGFEGGQYEIDLTDAERDKLAKALAPYIEAGRKTAGRGVRRSAGKTATSGGPTPAEVREWGKANGFSVPDRGRVPAEVREAYDAAH